MDTIPDRTSPPDGTGLGLLEQLLALASYRAPLTVHEAMLLCGSAYAVCPRCGITLERERMAFCDRCGQRLDWHSYGHARIVREDDR